MGQLVEGQWQTEVFSAPTDKKGAFVRPSSSFRHWVSNEPNSQFPVAANRYHLYVSYACPWACRTLIMRKLKGLEGAISFSTVDATMGENGWSFGQSGDDTRDPLYQANYLHQIYTAADPNYTGRVTVPVLWDKISKTIVNNESAEVMRMIDCNFNELAKNKVDYYPEQFRQEIDNINEFIYHSINNGVYRCGFAKTQVAYDDAFAKLFLALDDIELRLTTQRYLIGNRLTEADWRLFTTLIRFDPVYVCHFKTNLRRIEDYPNLSNYLRDLYQHPGIAETVRFDHIKQHYFLSHPALNPQRIIPGGPLVDYDRPHDRDRLEWR